MINGGKSSKDLLNELYPFIINTCENVLNNEYAQDLAHDIYLSMCEIDEEQFINLCERNEIKPYITRCIVNSRNASTPGRKKLYQSREHTELMEHFEMPEEAILKLNWSLLSDFEVLFLSKFVELKNVSEMSKVYGMSRNTVSKYINEIRIKLCG